MRTIRSRKVLLIALLIAAFATAAEASPWLWTVADDESALAHLAVVAIAVLSAFLTVAELWSVKPANTQPATTSAPAVSERKMENVPMYGNVALLFQSNFARTVLSGLAGLALVSTFDELWVGQADGQKPYFLVLFVGFFLAFLLLSAVARGLTEAGRSRISVVRRYPRRDGKLTYPFRLLWLWLLSLRKTLLVFTDTVFNVVLGRNQLSTAEFENEVAELHKSIVKAVDQIRREIDDKVEAALKKPRATSDEKDVRVCISVLSQDESALYYISREEGSIARGFGTGSLAWLSVCSGHPLWWKSSYEDHSSRIVLIDNESTGSGELRYPELKAKRHFLKDYFELRGDQDYKAFIILPLPWGSRGKSENHQKAGIHISFKKEEDLERLWEGLSPTVAELKARSDAGQATEEAPKALLNLSEHCEDLIKYRPPGASDASGPYLTDKELAANLERNVPLLGELLRHFNDTVFEEYIRPRLRLQ